MNVPPLFQLTGRRALVTGSSRGIGAAIATTLANAGADVAIHCTRDGDAPRRVAAQVSGSGVRTAIVTGDLGATGAAESVFRQAVDGLGAIDILVLNASLQIPREWRDISSADIEQQVAVNFRSSVELLQIAAGPMCDRGWGRLLTIGSVQEAKPHPQMLIYSALKNAQTGLALSLARQLASRGVTANNLAPGVIDTDRTHDRLTTPEYRQRVLGAIPVGRIGVPADCAGAALLLCSDAGAYITGQNLFVDGGMSL